MALFSKFRHIWVKTRSYPRHHWVFGSLQVSALIASIILMLYIPPPGYAVAVIALLAALLSIHEGMHNWQKAVWMVLIGLFLFIELRAIKKDRDDNQADQKVIRDAEQVRFLALIQQANQNFSVITGKADTIRKEQGQKFEDVLTHEKGILEHEDGQFKETIGQLTGGEDFPVVRPNIQPGDPMAILTILTSGTHMLWDVNVSGQELPIKTELLNDHLSKVVNNQVPMEYFAVITPDHGTFMKFRPTPSLIKVNEYLFSGFARNGIFTESLDIMHNDQTNNWVYKLRVTKSLRKPPKVLLDEDWHPVPFLIP